MSRTIMVPFDLAHADALSSAISTAGDLAKHLNGAITLVGVTGSAPTEAARNPAEFEQKLGAVATELSTRFGLTVTAKTVQDNDVAIDLGKALLETAKEISADLIVMASHIPGAIEHVFASNAGYVASHAKCSVYVVR